jgi:hypothetical protein
MCSRKPLDLFGFFWQTGEMGRVAQLSTSALLQEFEATLSDQENGADIVFLESREFGDFASCLVRKHGPQIQVRYTILDDELDDADVEALFIRGYLEEFLQGTLRNSCGEIAFENIATGVKRAVPYPTQRL